MKINPILTLTAIFIFILICSGTAMAAGEGNSSTIERNASLNYQSSQTSSQSEGASDTLNVQGYWINPTSTPLNTINVTSLQDEGITDVFISTSKSNPSSLQGFITKFNNSGIRVHAWVTCFHDGTSWTDPGNETVVNELTNSIINIATNYNVDGIHLDYARYSGTPGNEAYRYNGTTHVTSFVQNIYNEIQLINNQDTPNKPYILLSAALMPETSVNGYYYGQNYTQLAPYLDFMVPMIYKGNYGKNTTWIAYVTDYIVKAANGTPVVAGLQTYMSDTYAIPLPSNELEGDIQAALDNGSSGYVLFRYGLTDAFEETPYSYTNINNILDAATWVKNYIAEHGELPSTVSVGTEEVDMPIFLSLLARGLLYIHNGETGPIGVIDYNNPPNPSVSVLNGTILKNEYINLATRVLNFMNAYGRAPNFSGSSLGNIPYKDLFEIFSNVLDYYKLNNILPDSFLLNDTIPPTVTKTSPVNNETKISLTAPMIITFSENITAGDNYSGIYVMNTISGVKVAMTKTISANTLTIKQTTSRLYNTPYQVYIPAGAIKDMTGNKLTNAYTYTFTTLSNDSTPPTITSVDPTNNKVINVANKALVITFSENIKAGSAFTSIKVTNPDGVKVNPLYKVINGKTLTLTRNGYYINGLTYTITLPKGSITDTAGNTLKTAFTSKFKIDFVKPTITSVNPTNNKVINVANKALIITFSENIKAGSAFTSIKVTNPDGVKVKPLYKVINGKTLTLTRNGNYINGLTYTITLPTGSITDTAGNNINTYTSKFTVDFAKPTITRVNPRNNSSGFSLTAPITITFNENILEGVNWSKITMKNLNTGKAVSFTKTKNGKSLTIKMTYTRLHKNTYQIYIPAETVKDNAGNKQNTPYTLTFKTR